MFPENVASGRPSHQAMLKFSFNIRNANKEKFTVDTKMSCLQPSSFKAAYSGKVTERATFPQPPSQTAHPLCPSGEKRGARRRAGTGVLRLLFTNYMCVFVPSLF